MSESREENTSAFTALCFLPCLFLAPLAGMVTPYATAPVLILVGAAMFRSVSEISFSRIEDALPAFLTVVLIPLTFSITQCILRGFITHVGLYLLAGRRSEFTPLCTCWPSSRWVCSRWSTASSVELSPRASWLLQKRV